MSAEALAWARKIIPYLANDAQKLVMMEVAAGANPDGLYWPSHFDLSTSLGKSVRAIRRSLREIETEGLMSIKPRFLSVDGAQRSNYYHLFLGLSVDEYLKKLRAPRTVIMSTSKRERFANRIDNLLENISKWGAALASIKEQVNPKTFHTWYHPLRFRAIRKKTIVLIVPTEEFSNYHNEPRVRKLILDAAIQAFPGSSLSHVYFRIQN